MKNYQRLLIGAILILGAIMPVTRSEAGRIAIEIGDRPYYTRGPVYWDHGTPWVWTPGHWSRGHRHWVHGRYLREESVRGRLHRRHELLREATFR